MFPTYENLLKYKGKKFTVPGIKVAQPDGNERAVEVSLAEDAEHNLVLDRPGKYGNGIFVFYKPADATFGYADHGVTWACSGPYQGCHFQLGVHNGRIYAAHIAVESGGPGRPAQDHSEKLRKLLPEAIVKADHKTTLKEIGKAARVLGEHVSKYAFAHWGGNFAELTVTELTIIRGIDEGEIVSVDKIV